MRIAIDTRSLKRVASDLESTQKHLRGICNDLKKVEKSLQATNTQSYEIVSGALRRCSDNLAKNERSVSHLQSGINSIISIYSMTEASILLLGVDFGNVNFKTGGVARSIKDIATQIKKTEGSHIDWGKGNNKDWDWVDNVSRISTVAPFIIGAASGANYSGIKENYKKKTPILKTKDGETYIGKKYEKSKYHAKRRFLNKKYYTVTQEVNVLKRSSEYKVGAGKRLSDLSAGAKGGFTGLEYKLTSRIGSKYFNIHSTTSADVASAEGSVKAGLKGIDAKGDVHAFGFHEKYGFTLFGVEVNIKGDANLLGANAYAEYKVDKNGVRIGAGKSAGLFNPKGTIEVDWSKFKDYIKPKPRGGLGGR